MRAALLLLAAAGALALPVASAPALQAQPAAQRDWSRTVVQTPEGGFRMGNPDAPVKLVEYLSLTCPHCADFARDGVPALVRDHVRRGRVSLEYRNFVLNGVDAMAALIARCGGAERFFPIAGQFLATQNEWLERIEGLSQAQREQISALPAADQRARVAEFAGLTEIAGRHGLSAAETRRCLADPAGIQTLERMAQAASGAGVDSTPTFLINGARVPARDWGELEPLIRRAAG